MQHSMCSRSVAFLVLLWMQPASSAYNQSRARSFARLSAAAACSQGSLEKWNCGKCIDAVTSVTVCQGSVAQAYVGHWEGKCMLSFEGTHGPLSIIEDLRLFETPVPWDGCPNCSVHRGFLDHTSMKPCLVAALENTGCEKNSQLRSTGWSLGAAASSLAMVDLTKDGWQFEESYDFGKPRVGNNAFASHFSSRFGGGIAPKAWRVTHSYDPVPHLPPKRVLGQDLDFAQVEPEAFYPGDPSGGHFECSLETDERCSAQHSNLAVDTLHAFDHFTYVGILQGKRGCASASMEDVFDPQQGAVYV